MRDKEKTKLARVLRRNQTNAESLLWSRLRGKKTGLPRIRRQHPIGPYIVDFAVLSQKIIIEADGWTHETDEGLAKDKIRTAYLEKSGWRILRYDNNDIFDHLDYVIEKIRMAIITDDTKDSEIGH